MHLAGVTAVGGTSYHCSGDYLDETTDSPLLGIRP